MTREKLLAMLNKECGRGGIHAKMSIERVLEEAGFVLVPKNDPVHWSAYRSGQRTENKRCAEIVRKQVVWAEQTEATDPPGLPSVYLQECLDVIRDNNV